jgi:uncharacterized integral membrane protein
MRRCPLCNPPNLTVPSTSLKKAVSLATLASNSSAALGRPPVISLVFFSSLGNFAKISPAHYYKLEDGSIFGTIEPYKEDFCKTCNRIRLTAEGVIIPCLYFDEGKSIREAIRNKDIDKAVSILANVLANKPEKNKWSIEDKSSDRAFYVTGG